MGAGSKESLGGDGDRVVAVEVGDTCGDNDGRLWNCMRDLHFRLYDLLSVLEDAGIVVTGGLAHGEDVVVCMRKSLNVSQDCDSRRHGGQLGAGNKLEGQDQATYTAGGSS